MGTDDQFGPASEDQRNALRDALLEAVTARLREVGLRRDPAPILDPEAIDQAQQLSELIRGDQGDLQSRFLLGHLHWLRYRALPEGEGQADLRAAISMFVPCFLGRIDLELLPKPLLRVIADQAAEPVSELLGQALSSPDAELISAVADLHGRLLAATPVGHPQRAARLSNLGIALRARFELMGDRGDLDDAIQSSREALAASPTGHPERSVYTSNLGGLLWLRFQQTGALADLDEAIQMTRLSVAETPADHPNRVGRLTKLGNALHARFELTGDTGDRDEVIRLAGEARTAGPASFPQWVAYSFEQSATSHSVPEPADAPADRDEAVEAAREVLASLPVGDPQRPAQLINLGMALTKRFERLGTVDDLDEAIRVIGEAAATTSVDGHRVMFASMLGMNLRVRFEHGGRPADLDEAIRVGDEALDATPIDHPYRAMGASVLGTSLRLRFQRFGAPADLDEAIRVTGEAVAAAATSDTDGIKELSNLGVLLKDRYERTGELRDLDEAIRAGNEAATTVPPSHRDKPMVSSNLGIALVARYERVGAQTDLDEAIRLFDETLTATPMNHPDQAKYSSSLGNALRLRFERTGALEDLDRAIRVGREAVATTPAFAPDWPMYASNLGSALHIRYERMGDLGDLEEAIQVLREGVADLSPDHPQRPALLSNLGNALGDRFDRTGQRADLDEAIRSLRDAVAATPADDPYRAMYLSNLGAAVQTRFRSTDDPADLDEAIQMMSDAVAATPADHPHKARYLANLGSFLRLRFERLDSLADLDEAIRMTRQAMAATASAEPHRAFYASNLGGALTLRFKRVGGEADRDDAIRAFEDAMDVPLAPPSMRIQAARMASELAVESQPALAADLLERAVRLLPEAATRRLERRDQQYALSSLSGLASDAAALVLADPTKAADDRPTLALRLLEAGRAILFSQALETRSDVAYLAEAHPEIAERFVRLRDLWDDALSMGAPTVRAAGEGSDSGMRPAEEALRDRRELAKALSGVLEEIRALEGFESFGQPPTEAELLQEAAGGAVIALNVSRHRSDALLLTEEGVSSLPLPALAYDAVIGTIGTFHQALDTVSHGQTGSERYAAQQQLNQTLRWLWDVAADPILKALGHQVQATPGTAKPRVWWVPGGLMSLLPVHAAGYHDDSEKEPGRRTVIDRVISSYTPTIGALRYARRAANPAKTPYALIVAMPTTPGLHGGRLDFVREEAQKLAALLPGSITLTEPDPIPAAEAAGATTIGASGQSTMPTRANVLAQLADRPIAHFACHGFNDAADPSNSQLLLHDHRTTPFTVAALAGIRLDHAQLAYLSACATAATSDLALIDEAIHLASGFQLAGYRHVVATLWAINDEIAATIAADFYAAVISRDDTTSTFDPARALDKAICAARNTFPATPSLWAAHIHTGA